MRKPLLIAAMLVAITLLLVLAGPRTTSAQVAAAFSGEVPPPGSMGLLVTTAFFYPAQLEPPLRIAGCEPVTIAMMWEGAWRVHVVGAPAKVNASTFPGGMGATTPFLVRCSVDGSMAAATFELSITADLDSGRITVGFWPEAPDGAEANVRIADASGATLFSGPATFTQHTPRSQAWLEQAEHGVELADGMTVTADSGSVSSALVVSQLAVTDVDFAAGTFVVTGSAGTTFDAVIGSSGCGYNGGLLDVSGRYRVGLPGMVENCGFSSSPLPSTWDLPSNRIFLRTPADNPGTPVGSSTTMTFYASP